VALASSGPYASLHLAPEDNHTRTPPLSFLQAGRLSCRPTNSVKALKATLDTGNRQHYLTIDMQFLHCEAVTVTWNVVFF